VGQIVGRGAGAQDPLRAATADLRKQAAQLGATYVRHQAPATIGGVTISGTAFRCTFVATAPEGAAVAEKAADASTAEAAAPNGETPAVDAVRPTGAGGFKFGDTLAQTTERCTSAGHVFKERGRGYHTCSALPQTVGHPADATLWFRDDALVLIRLTVTPQSADVEEWLEAYDGLATAVEGKYGPAKSTKRTPPAGCEGKALAACLNDGRLAFSSLWEFDENLRIELSLGQAKDRAATAIRLLYDQSGPRPKGVASDAL
jgi:hypothetical protein